MNIANGLYVLFEMAIMITNSIGAYMNINKKNI